MSLFVLDLSIRGFCFVSRHSPHVVKLCVRSHVSQMGHAVGQSKEGSNGSNVPNILSVKTMSLQGAEMFFSYCFTPADCQSKVQHGLLTGAQLRNPVINCNLCDKTVPVKSIRSPLVLFIIFLEYWVWEGVEQFYIMFCEIFKYLISQHGFFGIDAVQCTVGYHTIQAVIVSTGRNHNQFPVRFWQTTCYKSKINPGSLKH